MTILNLQCISLGILLKSDIIKWAMSGDIKQDK